MCTCMCLECEIESCYLQTGILMRNLCIPVQCTHKIKITLSIKDQFCCNEWRFFMFISQISLCFFFMNNVVEKCFHVFLFYTRYKTVVFYPLDRALALFMVCIFSVHVVCVCVVCLKVTLLTDTAMMNVYIIYILWDKNDLYCRIVDNFIYFLSCLNLL